MKCPKCGEEKKVGSQTRRICDTWTKPGAIICMVTQYNICGKCWHEWNSNPYRKESTYD